MVPNFTAQASFMVSVIQSSKKQWNKTYITNEKIKDAFDAYVDKQTAFVKQILTNVDVVFDEYSKEAGKIISAGK